MVKLIPIGLQCSVSEAIRAAGVRAEAYPFDWLFCPASTSLAVFRVLLASGVDAAAALMVDGTGESRYRAIGNERFVRSETPSYEYFINAATGLGVTHYAADTPAFADMIKRRLRRLLDALAGPEPLMFMYADAASEADNYEVDGTVLGLDATDTLVELAELLSASPLVAAPFKVVYYCWRSRFVSADVGGGKLAFCPFEPMASWVDVSLHIVHAVPTSSSQQPSSSSSS